MLSKDKDALKKLRYITLPGDDVICDVALLCGRLPAAHYSTGAAVMPNNSLRECVIRVCGGGGGGGVHVNFNVWALPVCLLIYWHCMLSLSFPFSNTIITFVYVFLV